MQSSDKIKKYPFLINLFQNKTDESGIYRMGFANFQWIYICIFIKIYEIQNEPFSGECTLSTLNRICRPLFMFGNGTGGTFITTIASWPCSPSSQFRPVRAGSRKWKITKIREKIATHSGTLLLLDFAFCVLNPTTMQSNPLMALTRVF